MDHSEMLSRLIIFLGAGMSIRTAWDKIAEDYKRAVNEGRSEMHYVYEEMYITGSQLKSGISEAKAFAEFGTRCGLQQYMKLSGLLEQNRKNGSKNLRETLRLEMAEAFEQRKHQARRMGEKAGTKLLVPLFLLLGSGHGNDYAPGMDYIWMILSRNIAVLDPATKASVLYHSLSAK